MTTPYGYSFVDPRKQMVTPELLQRLARIRLLMLDVDGILTDGTIWWVEGTGWTRAFNVRDGHGMKLIMRAGIEIAFISGGDSKAVRERAQFLGIKHTYLGSEDKLVGFHDLLKKTGFQPQECAFMGDDLFDRPVLREVGFAGTVPNAVPEVKELVHFITHQPGGEGAVREVCDLILRSKGLGP